MSNDDMPDFGGEHQQQPEKSPGGKIDPMVGLSPGDQADAIKKLVKFVAIGAGCLFALILLFKAGKATFNYFSVGRLESQLQKVIDEKLIEKERAAFQGQADDWVAKVQPDYDQYYPEMYKSRYEFDKLVGAHKALAMAAEKRLDYVEEQIKIVLRSPTKTEYQIREALNLWADWKDETTKAAERAVKDEEREVNAYFAPLKKKEQKEEPKEEKPAAPAPQPQAAKPSPPPQVKELANDKKYLEEIQRALKGAR